MSERLPVLSDAQLIGVLRNLGWKSVRQLGSHVSLRHPDRSALLVVPLHCSSFPLHCEPKRGTLDGILLDAGIGREELRKHL